MRLAVLLLAGSARLAAAQPAAPGPDPDHQVSEADELFHQGRDHLAKGDRAGACKLFDESFAKDPRAVGTMLNLGLCREEDGAVASAVRFYAEARDRAHDQKLQEHQEAAERKIAMLSPRVPHIAIVLPPNVPAGVRVIVDTQVLAPDQLGDLAVDPGTRAIVVTAPNKLPYEQKLDIKEAEHLTVRVPPLEGAKTVIIERETNNRRLYGKIGVVGGVTLGALAIGLGLYARNLYWKQFPKASMDGEDATDMTHPCFTSMGVPHCSPLGTSKVHTANTVAAFGTGLGVVSVLALGLGAYLWITSPANVALDVGHDHASVAATVRF